MTILTILEFPDPRLRTIAKTVNSINTTTLKLIDDMFETMYAAPGIGLAATQVNVHERILVIDVSEEKDRRVVLGFVRPRTTSMKAPTTAAGPIWPSFVTCLFRKVAFAHPRGVCLGGISCDLRRDLMRSQTRYRSHAI